MQKIRAFLSVRDPSFCFYVHYPDLPFDKNIKIPEGNIKFCLAAPTSDDFKKDSMDFGKVMIEQAERGVDEDSNLEIECPVLVILEQEIDSKIIGEYKSWRDYIYKTVERAECKEVDQQIINNVEKGERGDTLPKYPEYHIEMFTICRIYLKRFLLSLRENGNVCKLRFHDYYQPKDEFSFGLFGKYYFDFQLRDEKGILLFDERPLSQWMKGSRPKDHYMIKKRLSPEESKRWETNLITTTTWEHICAELASEFEPDLARTFLLDAQDEALSGNISMAVICTAIACEILTDRFISTEASKIPNKIYDYIIDKVPEISVMDLLDVPLKSLIGYSIKEKHRKLWNDLQKLFQARNKVAHVGKCCYTSTSGKTQIPVDPKQTMHFIESAYEFFEILGARSS